MSSSSVIDIQVQRNREREERARKELVAQSALMLTALGRLEAEVREFNAAHAAVVQQVEFRPFTPVQSDRLNTVDSARQYLHSIRDHMARIRAAFDHKRGLAVAEAFKQFRDAAGPRSSADVIRAASRPSERAKATTRPLTAQDQQRLQAIIQQHCASDPQTAQRCHHLVANGLRPGADADATIAYIEQELRDAISRQRAANTNQDRIESLHELLAGLEGAEVKACHHALEQTRASGQVSAALETRVHTAARTARAQADRKMAYKVFLAALQRSGHSVDVDQGVRAMAEGGRLVVKKATDKTWGDRHAVEITVDPDTGAVGAHVTRVDGDSAAVWADPRVVERFAAVERLWCEDLDAALEAAAANGIPMSIRPDTFVQSQLTAPIPQQARQARAQTQADAVPRTRAINPNDSRGNT